MTTSLDRLARLDDLRKEYFNPPKEDTRMEPKIARSATPGPWDFTRFHPLDPWDIRNGATMIARTCADDHDNAIEEANARLIASAPALRDALQTLTATVDKAVLEELEDDTCDCLSSNPEITDGLNAATAALALIDKE